MNEKRIMYCGVTLNIVFNHSPAFPAICNSYGVPEEQGNDEDFELVAVLAGEIDILPILNDAQQTEILKIIEGDM